MALPAEIGPESAEAIRRAVVVLAFWEAGREIEDPRLHRQVGDALALEEPEREVVRLYAASSGRFSFFDRRAANWLFGHVVAAILGRGGDFAIVRPAAAWAIQALNETDRVCREALSQPEPP